jgi:hypothetical protein
MQMLLGATATARWGRGIPVSPIEGVGERCRVLKLQRTCRLPAQLREIRLEVVEKCVARLLRCSPAIMLSAFVCPATLDADHCGRGGFTVGKGSGCEPTCCETFRR